MMRPTRQETKVLVQYKAAELVDTMEAAVEADGSALSLLASGSSMSEEEEGAEA